MASGAGSVKVRGGLRDLLMWLEEEETVVEGNGTKESFVAA